MLNILLGMRAEICHFSCAVYILSQEPLVMRLRLLVPTWGLRRQCCVALRGRLMDVENGDLRSVKGWEDMQATGSKGEGWWEEKNRV
jgi:hypothetical protein